MYRFLIIFAIWISSSRNITTKRYYIMDQNQYQNQNQQQPYQQQPYQQQPYYQQPYYQPNYMQGQRPPKPDNYLVWAILTTLFCCLPFGIVSIVYSSKVDTLYSSGDYVNAQQASDNAKKWAWWSAIACAICVALYLMFLLIVAAIAASK